MHEALHVGTIQLLILLNVIGPIYVSSDIIIAHRLWQMTGFSFNKRFSLVAIVIALRCFRFSEILAMFVLTHILSNDANMNRVCMMAIKNNRYKLYHLQQTTLHYVFFSENALDKIPR